MTDKAARIFKIYPHILSILFMLLFVLLAINPVDRDVWIVEDTPIVITFILLVFTFRFFRFSNYSYTLMSAWMFWHTVGGHYTFANVPFDFITHLFGFERNNFDRVGHLVVGFYAFAAAELLTRKKWSGPVLATFFGLFFIMSIAAWYEILEWIYAVLHGGQAGIEFLGSQGDIWDAQKDMLFDMFGALFALVLFWIIRPDLKIDKHVSAA
ncbi:DUF2238 domain-containing protein [Sulfurimonas sp. HSL-1716]|uniref:DUF2238 domain-containing protein n=1 Tax=Hydrocurvibacter sulfurireducens TaxID=3131937 RepID=UPI0031F9615F